MTRASLPRAHGAWLSHRQIRAIVLIWFAVGFILGIGVHKWMVLP